VKGTLRDVGISLLGAAAAGSLILGLTRLLDPLGTSELVSIWVVAVGVVCMYPLLMRTGSGAILPPGTILVGTTGLLILSNSPTDYLVVPACLILALVALRTLPDMASMKAPLSLALAGASLELTGGLFWLTGLSLLKEMSWWASAVGGALVVAGFALAAARPTARGYKLANVALGLAALGVAGGWMAEALWELIGRVFVPYQDAYVASMFPSQVWIGTFTGTSYLTVTVGLLLLMYAAKGPERRRFKAAAQALVVRDPAPPYGRPNRRPTPPQRTVRQQRAAPAKPPASAKRWSPGRPGQTA